MILFVGPPGCTTASTVQRLLVLRAVRPPAVTAFSPARPSAGAFSGRPAIAGRLIIFLIYDIGNSYNQFDFRSYSFLPPTPVIIKTWGKIK